MTEEVDGIILGAGHNGLILQCYAARAGLSTICLERRDQAGGGLTTVEYPDNSGFLHNTHSFFHRGITRMPWYSDLELDARGATYVQPELNVALIARDGQTLEWWSDFQKTADSVAAFSERDAETLSRWRSEFKPIVEDILIPESQAPPLPRDIRQKLLMQSSHGQRLLEVSQLSPLEFVTREFEHPVVQAGLLFFNGLREVDLRLPGFGHHIPSLLASDAMAQMCRGGASRLADALVDAVTKFGGRIQTGVALKRIDVENGRTTAVECEDGQRFVARKFIASSLNPQQTFIDLIDPQHLPSNWRQRASSFRYNRLAPLFALNVNLCEPPAYSAAASAPQINDALMVIVGLDEVAQFHDIVRHHELGTIPPTVMWGACPTRFDTSQAPPGKHTAFMWEKLPYAIHGDSSRWDALANQHADRMLAKWAEYAPNLPAAMLDRFTRTPRDIERTLPNMAFGDLLVGSFEEGQVGFHRPFLGAGNYRGHLAGLYLCGSCCHPGGNVTGLPGYNCSQVLLADLGIPDPRTLRPIESRFPTSD